MVKAERGKLPVITLGQIAEDFSQGMTADVVLTYNCTPEERALGLARIYVAASREEEGEFTVLISQDYRTGQFCRSCVRMSKQTQTVLMEQIRAADDPRVGDVK
jgi:hypothetical protein